MCALFIETLGVILFKMKGLKMMHHSPRYLQHEKIQQAWADLCQDQLSLG